MKNINQLNKIETMGLLQEFKTFALKGNVIDMAVGVIIGGAFGKIVTGLVENIINPVIAKLTGKINALPQRDDIDLNIKENLIVEYYSRIINPENMAIAVVGDIDENFVAFEKFSNDVGAFRNGSGQYSRYGRTLFL